MEKDEITVFAKTNFRNRDVPFGIRTDDRRRHMYIIGKTGMGKTTLMENMIIQDILSGRGVAFVDPHGDSVEKILDYIPSKRVNDVIYINPADVDYPLAFNILESVDSKYKHLVASGLMGVFTKIWANLWSARMEYILNNSILALLDSPGNTLLGIARLLVDKKYRKKIVDNVKDPMVRTFWMDEFANWPEKYRMESIAPIQNKVGQFLSSGIIRNIVGQAKSTLDLREAMDSKKIILMNLSKGRVGEDNSALLGAMIITKLQLAALSRVDIPEEEREDFYLYVDEFQNFATESFATILSEARKYRLNLTIGHQYIGQLVSEKNNTKVRDAVFGNVGTIISFRVGAADAEFLEKEFEPTFMQNDLVNLPRATVVLRLMINSVASDPFTAVTLPPGTYERTGNADKVIRVSRERYANPVAEVEEKITRWMGADDIHESAAVIASHAKIEGRDDDEDEEVVVPAAAVLPEPAAVKIPMMPTFSADQVDRFEPEQPVAVPPPSIAEERIDALKREPELVAPVVQSAASEFLQAEASFREVVAEPIPERVAEPAAAPVFKQKPRPQAPQRQQQHQQQHQQQQQRRPFGGSASSNSNGGGGSSRGFQRRDQSPKKTVNQNPIWDRVAEINQERTKKSTETSKEIAKKFESQADGPRQSAPSFTAAPTAPTAPANDRSRTVLRPGEAQKIGEGNGQQGA